MMRRFFNRSNHPFYLTVFAACFLLLGLLEIYQAHIFSAEKIHSNKNLVKIITEDFEYRPNFPYYFQAKTLYKYGILHVDIFSKQRRDFYFYLPYSESQLLFYRLGKSPKIEGTPKNGVTICKCNDHQVKPAIAVYYTTAFTPLEYLFLNAHESGNWGTKIYAIQTGVIVDGNFGSGSIPYLAADRMKNIAYICFFLSALLLYKARKRSKTAKI